MSHNCENTQARVYLYLDHELSMFRRLRVWWHLRQCPPCEKGFAFERKLKQRVHDDCREEPPGELYDRLRTFLREHGTDDTDVG